MDYSSVINQATANYNKVLQGYQTTLAQQQAAQQGIIAGYNQLSDATFADLRDADAGQKQAIVDQYAAESGKMQQALINRGLGNTTVQGAMQRGLTLDQAKAQNDLTGKFAGLKADARMRIGLSGLGYAGSALQSNLAFAGQGLQTQQQGAMDLGQLGLGYAKLKNDRELAEAQLANQRRTGFGGGGGSSSGGRSPMNLDYGGGSYRPRYSPPSHAGAPHMTQGRFSDYTEPAYDPYAGWGGVDAGGGTDWGSINIGGGGEYDWTGGGEMDMGAWNY